MRFCQRKLGCGAWVWVYVGPDSDIWERDVDMVWKTKTFECNEK